MHNHQTLNSVHDKCIVVKNLSHKHTWILGLELNAKLILL